MGRISILAAITSVLSHFDPLLRREGRCVAAGAMTANSLGSVPPKSKSQTLPAFLYRKVKVARLNREAENLNFSSESELLHREQ